MFPNTTLHQYYYVQTYDDDYKLCIIIIFIWWKYIHVWRCYTFECWIRGRLLVVESASYDNKKHITRVTHFILGKYILYKNLNYNNSSL